MPVCVYNILIATSYFTVCICHNFINKIPHIGTFSADIKMDVFVDMILLTFLIVSSD